MYIKLNVHFYEQDSHVSKLCVSTGLYIAFTVNEIKCLNNLNIAPIL